MTEQPSITCPDCGRTSYNPNDIEQGYCGYCHDWTSHPASVREAEGALPRKTPCASCPFRKNVASGVWDESEYAKLPDYDGETHEQKSMATFFCHHGDGQVCSGWLGHRDPIDMLAVRIGISIGKLDPSVAEYQTSVPLFESGAAAAEHGRKEIEAPGPKAADTIRKVVKKRGAKNE